MAHSERTAGSTDASTAGAGDQPHRGRQPEPAPVRATAGADHATHGGHGHSTAAWSLVGTVMVGGLIASIAVVIASVWLFVVGCVVMVAGVGVGKVLSAMGFGAGSHTAPGGEEERTNIR